MRPPTISATAFWPALPRTPDELLRWAAVFTRSSADRYAEIAQAINDGQRHPTLTLTAHANNAAAIAAGLTVGSLYRTGGDPDVVCVVH